MVKLVGVVTLGALMAVTVTAQQPPSPAEAGRKVYERQKCATCHQIAKRGNSRFPLDGVGSRLTAEQIRRWMTHPSEMEAALPRMPALRMSTMNYRLNTRDLDALVAYLQTLK
jgi:mono/diheme cytochrome c family protein